MINISIVKDKNGFIWKFEILGHSGYAEQGSDIVCAGVSALAYTAVGAITDMTGIGEWEQKDGYMKFIVPKNVPNEKKSTIKTILEAIVIGFRQIELSYEGYVKVIVKEV